jgi:beta-glucosidase
MILRQTQQHRLLEPDTFLWCTGIEDTFITAPWPKTGRTLDEYELTQHYSRWEADFSLVAELGVKTMRYGVPWHRANPLPGRWDWDFVDRSLGRLLELGIEPIVDLVHYGLPSWIEGAFLNPDFPRWMAEYASRLAERFKGSIHAYTPLNEPRITAWYCGRIGWWPPFRFGWSGFVAVMLGVCRGIVETVHALRAVDPEILPVHVDATDLYGAAEPALQEEAERRQEIVFLALDLISGRVREGHALASWLREHGATDEDLAWFQERAIDLPLIGMNLYPMFTNKTLVRGAGGRQRIRMDYASGELIERLSRLYWQRYQAPLFISETASVGSIRRRRAWLEDSVQAVRNVRAAGLPLVGYTWWPMFALVTWAYRQGNHAPGAYLKQFGLWDCDADLNRISTPLVDAYRALSARGAASAGPLNLSAAAFETSPCL